MQFDQSTTDFVISQWRCT